MHYFGVKLLKLNLFGIAFTAGTFAHAASAAYLDVVKRAVATCVIVLATCYVAGNFGINVFHISPPNLFCAKTHSLCTILDKIGNSL